MLACRHKIRLVGKCSGHDQLQRSNGYGVIQLVMTKFKSIAYDNATQVRHLFVLLRVVL